MDLIDAKDEKCRQLFVYFRTLNQPHADLPDAAANTFFKKVRRSIHKCAQSYINSRIHDFTRSTSWIGS